MHKITLSAPVALMAATRMLQANVPFDMHFAGGAVPMVELRCKHQETLLAVAMQARNEHQRLQAKMEADRRQEMRDAGHNIPAETRRIDMDQH